MVRLIYVALLALLFSLCACTADKTAPPVPAGSPADNSQPSGPGDGLPSLADLPAPGHQVNAIDLGWFEIRPSDESYLRGGSGISVIPASVTVGGPGTPGFALYAVDGFNGDNAPGSLRVTGFGYNGEYYIGFACFAKGCWSFSGPFTGSTEAVIPGTGDIPHPTAYTSSNGTAYFAIIAPADSSLIVTNLQLGVYAGNLGPAPLNEFYGSGGPAGIHLQWLASTSCQEPDFAGYYIERAPFTWGDYTPVVTLGPLADYYIDTAAELDLKYRYRIAAFDTGGNCSAWFASIGSAHSTWFDYPVAVLDIPDGPLYGPVDVTFDMSNSFDLGTTGIDNYILATAGNVELYTGNEAVVTRTLQPGCYTFSLRVVTPDFREDITVRHLKVYPRWRPDSVVVSYPEELYSNVLQYRSITHPATGRLTYYAHDHSLKGLSSWTRTPGGSFVHRSLPLYTYSSPFWIGEPVVINSEVLIPVNVQGRVNIARDDGTDFCWLGSGITSSQGECMALAASPDGADVRLMFIAESPPGNFNLKLRSLINNSLDDISATFAADSQLDMVYNPTDACFDIVYGEACFTKWIRFVPGTGFTSTETLALTCADAIDVEINPDTGQPAVLYFFGDRQRYRALDATATTWSPEVILDNLTANLKRADLLATENGLCAMINRLGVAGKLFASAGSTWTLRNEVIFPASVPASAITIANLGGGDIALGVIDDDYVSRFTILHDDGTRVDFHTILPLEGQGQGLTATTGDPDIHVTWPQLGKVVHFTSPDGETWTEQASLSGYSQPVLFANSNGKAYLSHQFCSQARLVEWNGVSWDLLLTRSTNLTCLPVTTAQPFIPAVNWGVYDDTVVPAELNWNYCSGSVSTSIKNPTETIWAGTNNLGSFYSVFCLYSGATILTATTGFYNTSAEGFIPLFKSNYVHSGDTYTAGRMLDGAIYLRRGIPYSYSVYWASYGPQYAPVRVELDNYGVPIVTELPFEMDWGHSDWRRSTSAIYADGGCAVGLICSATGNETWFEWDNFGDWENLPLPTDLGPMALPELVKSFDGRWHIIYRDGTSDQIKCRSAL